MCVALFGSAESFDTDFACLLSTVLRWKENDALDAIFQYLQLKLVSSKQELSKLKSLLLDSPSVSVKPNLAFNLHLEQLAKCASSLIHEAKQRP